MPWILTYQNLIVTHQDLLANYIDVLIIKLNIKI